MAPLTVLILGEKWGKGKGEERGRVQCVCGNELGENCHRKPQLPSALWCCVQFSIQCFSALHFLNPFKVTLVMQLFNPPKNQL